MHIETLSRNYGIYLARQSDKNFPRTRFPSILTTTKRQGHNYAGMLLCVLVTLVSTPGQQIVKDMVPNVFDDEFINKQVHLIKLILCIEEFLKHGKLKNGDLHYLPKFIVHFINCITSTCKREGMGNRLIKNHLYFHLPKYISLWGQPKGWDSAPSESHHHDLIKAPSKATQQNAHTLIQQTANRKTEYKNFAMAKVLLRHDNFLDGA